MAGIDQGLVMASEIQSFPFPQQGEAVRRHGPLGILHRHLPIILGRGHIRRLDSFLGNQRLHVGMELAAADRCHEPIALRQPKVAHQRVLQLPDDGVGLLVEEFGTETNQAAVKRNGEFQRKGKILSNPLILMHGSIAEDNRGAVGSDFREKIGPVYLDFPLVRRIEIQPPERTAAGIVRAGREIAKFREPSPLIYADTDPVAGKGERLRPSGEHRSQNGRSQHKKSSIQTHPAQSPEYPIFPRPIRPYSIHGSHRYACHDWS